MHPTRLPSRLGVVLASTSLMLAILTSALVAASNIEVGAAAAVTSHASKSAFCAANDTIDKAAANVTTNAAFLAVLKSHASQLKILQENAPSGSLGQLAQQVVKGADTAIAANDANDLNNLPDGSAIDTYCGVDGNGQPLPAYFNTGTKTTFCKTFITLWGAVQNATSQADVLTVIVAHKSLVTELASELSTLPSSIKTTATTGIDNVQKAISEKSAKLLGGGYGNLVALYCGQNQ